MIAWRPAVMGKNGVVACAHFTASLAGHKALMNGGNAVDAVVAIAATLNVVEPYMSGIGGSGLMQITSPDRDTPVVLNYTGGAPGSISKDGLTKDELTKGPKSIEVPGALAGWFAAHERYGSLPFADLLAMAIDLAENGAPVSHKNQTFINDATEQIHDEGDARATFYPDGSPPKSHSLLRQPALAETYRRIAADGPGVFYRGPIGERVAAAVQAAGGFLSVDDLASYEVEWSEPISIDFAGYTLYGGQPPICSFETFQVLRILEQDDLTGMGHNSADYVHRLIEAIKLASADRIAYAQQQGFDPASVLSDDYIASQRARIDDSVAAVGQGESYGEVPESAVMAGRPFSEHTTHFAAADASGMAVNVTQTLGSPFGSGFMAGDTGIMMNNLLNWTDLDERSPNALEPGKRMENPMSPAQIYRDGQFIATIGTPGSWGILQTTAQMILNLLVHEMNIQEAIEAPRVRFMGGKRVFAEERIATEIRDELVRRGHEIEPIGLLSWQVGGGHGTYRDPASGVFSGGADPRRDGYAMAW
jgi:gamma-glutamyltranspeptidase / glutathione hydrolase